MTALHDDNDRLLAVTTFDKNVVVTAGAGTGKTTLLVDRITHLLMRDAAPLKITDILAITFTKKAANEMKLRLRNRLQHFIDTAKGGDGLLTAEKRNYEAELLKELMQRYNLSMEVIAERAGDAVNNLEKAQIGTIHSFAGHILRLYPLEAGIAPDFEEDDGSGFERHFELEWEEWLDKELSADSQRKEEWKEVLRTVSIESAKVFAKCLCRETVPIHSIESQTGMDYTLSGSILTWLKKECETAQNILNNYDWARKVNMHGLLKKSIELFNHIIEGSDAAPFVDNISARPPADWIENDYMEACRIVSVAQALSIADEAIIRKLTALVFPFVVLCRKSFVISGNMSFDGLLAFSCNILKNQSNIRCNLKKGFKSILVDEFQDTDPLQYEIILYLAEKDEVFEEDWRQIRLASGKLFIVGDPKQSIYAFRGADIEAYYYVVDMIMKQGGVIANLSTNFRSHKGIIDVVNSVCGNIIKRRDYIQPEYIPIMECPGHEAVKRLQRVELRLVDTRNADDCSAEEAIGFESIAIGKFLKEEMIGKETITDPDGSEMPVSPRHIAILLPKLTQVHEYLYALKRLKIPYIVEGDRHFYGTQEVIDFVNLLRVIDNPLDKTAMAGFLRSPLGGISDRELYELCRLSLLDYRIEDVRLNERLDELNHSGFNERRLKEFKELIPALYGLMRRFYVNVSQLPVPDAIHYIFDNSPVLELAASSSNGEQSVANLQKIYRIAEAMSDKSNLTLKGLTALLEMRVASKEKEGESLLSEEGVDAVRILSIHRAKGLEFPVVVLGNMHGMPNRGRDLAALTYEWSGGMTGMSVSDYSNYTAVMMQDKERLIEKEERKRLLYVAMTRARECLILSGVLGKRRNKDSFLSMLMDSYRGSAGDNLSDEVRLDKGILRQTVIDYRSCTIPDRPARGGRMSNDNISPEKIEYLSGLWDRRDEKYRAILDKVFFVTPSSVERDIAVTAGKTGKLENNKFQTADSAIQIGNIAHYILSKWDFDLDVSLFKEAVEDACRKFMPDTSLQLNNMYRVAAELSGETGFSSVQSELEDMFEKFSASPVYQELKTSEVLGREVPFSIPWDGRVMEGVIDIIYRYGGNLYAADYKTDRVSEDAMDSKINDYTISAGIYIRAVQMCMGAELSGFKFIFLRNGKSVKV